MTTSVGGTFVDTRSVRDHILRRYFLVLSRRVTPHHDQPLCAIFLCSFFLCLFSVRYVGGGFSVRARPERLCSRAETAIA